MSLDEPPQGWRLANPQDAKAVMAALLSGKGARIGGECAGEAGWLAGLPQGDGVRITCSAAPVDTGPAHLHFAPQVFALGVGCARDCPPGELSALVRQTLAEAGVAAAAIGSVNTIDLKAR